MAITQGDIRQVQLAKSAVRAGIETLLARAGLTPDALAELAGAEAFYQLLLAEEAVTPQSLTAGSLKLAGGSNSQKAQRLAAEKRRAVSPALVETDFYFGRMEKGEDNGPAE